MLARINAAQPTPAIRPPRRRAASGPAPRVSVTRRAVGWMLAATVFALTILAGSPHAHAAVHADADHTDHVCPVTLAQQGFCDTTAPAPEPGVPQAVTARAEPVPSTGAWSIPDYWHVPAHAPPVG